MFSFCLHIPCFILIKFLHFPWKSRNLNRINQLKLKKKLLHFFFQQKTKENWNFFAFFLTLLFFCFLWFEIDNFEVLEKSIIPLWFFCKVGCFLLNTKLDLACSEKVGAWKCFLKLESHQIIKAPATRPTYIMCPSKANASDVTPSNLHKNILEFDSTKIRENTIWLKLYKKTQYIPVSI